MPTAPAKPTVVTLSREEMRSRALAFSKDWVGPQREEAEAKTFLDQFLRFLAVTAVAWMLALSIGLSVKTAAKDA